MKHISAIQNNFIRNGVMLYKSDSIELEKRTFFIAEINVREQKIKTMNILQHLNVQTKLCLFYQMQALGFLLLHFLLLLVHLLGDQMQELV